MGEAASVNRCALCASAVPGDGETHREGVLLLPQAGGAGDAAERACSVLGAGCALPLLGQGQKHPLPSLHPGRTWPSSAEMPLPAVRSQQKRHLSTLTCSSGAKKVHGAPQGFWQRKAGCTASMATGCLLPLSFS